MKLGFVGLGKMGMNMVTRLSKEHEIIVYDRNTGLADRLDLANVTSVSSVEMIVKSLDCPRFIWLMIPADAVEAMIPDFYELLSYDDVLIDGGNSYYKDSARRAEMFSMKNIHYLDVGTSGGLWGLEKGYCLMVGGNITIYKKAEPFFRVLAGEAGYSHAGSSGAGHYVKMIHNGIEYAIMQAYAEGFDLLKNKKEYNIDCSDIAGLWNRGSVIRSWLLELIGNIFEKNEDLADIEPYVEDSGEGRWTVHESIEQGIPVPVIAMSLFERFSSRLDNSYARKILASLRNEFGGHSLNRKDDYGD